MRPGTAAVCTGTVMHHRRSPADHRFTYAVNQVWLDPDRPEALCADHPLWSATRPAPIRFRRSDYFDGRSGPIGPALQDLVGREIGHRPDGEVRMLTQPRTWGWLFNPITIYLLWDDAPATGPIAAVLEVTNTPWKERHRYALALSEIETTTGNSRYTSVFDKVLHVSPFLDEDFQYRLNVSEAHNNHRLTVELDVLPPKRIHPARQVEVNNDEPLPILSTRLVIDRLGANRTNMTKALVHNPLPTHRVSVGIHRQALALWRKRVRFVSHPKRRQADPTSEPLETRP